VLENGGLLQSTCRSSNLRRAAAVGESPSVDAEVLFGGVGGSL